LNVRSVFLIGIMSAGLLLFGYKYGYLSAMSEAYDYPERLRTGAIEPSYDLATLPWHVVKPAAFTLNPGGSTLVTSDDPLAYQVTATINTGRASAADIYFDADLESGAVTIGLLQAGTWIASNSSRRTGTFSDSNSVRLGFHRSLTVVIANNNAAGTSRLFVRSLRVLLR
jgi:hypothetical protein